MVSPVLRSNLRIWRGRDVDVVGAGQVVVVGRAEEAVAVGQDFEDAFGEDVAFFFALGLEDLEDEVLLAQGAGAGDFEAAGELAEFGNALFFQFGDGHEYLVVSIDFLRGWDVCEEGVVRNHAGSGECRRAEVQRD